MKNIIATIKSWNVENAKGLRHTDKGNKWYLVTDKEDLTKEKVDKINPAYIFFPHWSWIIPQEIWRNYECVVFHETDLPFGKGSRPIQNLIMLGYEKTKISALKVEEALDRGPIYLKKPLDISTGSVHDILKKSSEIIFGEMIPEIIKGIEPYEQSWDEVDSYFVPSKEVRPEMFKRKETKEKANLSNLLKEDKLNLKKICRIIRAFQDDYECGDPKAYLPVQGGKIEFYDAEIIDNKLYAKSEFIGNKND